MARSNITTLLPLDRYAEIMRIPLLHFNQLGGSLAPTPVECGGFSGIWDQQDRDVLAETMNYAIDLITEELGFFPARKYVTNEEHLFGTLGIEGNWINRELGTDYKLVSAYGTEKLTLKQQNATIQLIDNDNDPLGYKEVARIGGSLYEDLGACDNESEVAIFYRVADGAKDAAHPAWEIKPIIVDIDGSTMRIEGHAALFTKPSIWDLTRANSGEYDDWIGEAGDGAVVNAVDVYCRTTNIESPVTLKWDGLCSCTTPCSHKTQTACALPVNARGGKFNPRPSSWNGTDNIYTTPTYGWTPEKITVNYLSGYPPGTHGVMSPLMERAVVKLTNALLPEPPCGFCGLAKTVWQKDRSPVDQLTISTESMPWASFSWGALEAWRIVKMFMYGKGN